MPRLVKPEVVARSLERLRSQRVHSLFAGYLCLQHRVGRTGVLTDIKPNFKEFFQYFYEVQGHPSGTPYIKPFTEQAPSASNLWLNSNIAGSYAPSSIRSDQPFGKVVHIEGKTYNLPENHALLARRHLLYDQQIPVAELAVFLYRDFGLTSDEPTIHELIDVFAWEFGYSTEPGDSWNDDFDTLFSAESAEDWPEDWLG